MRRIGSIAITSLIVLLVVLVFWIWLHSGRGTTGEVSTHFRWLGPNDRIVVDGFDDPKVKGVACHISRAVTGGVKGGLGLAEDTSDASIACRQVGPIQLPPDLTDGESVFEERRSLIFKRLHVVRFFDKQRNVLVYVSYSDRVIGGSPKNSISTVPVMGWVAPLSPSAFTRVSCAALLGCALSTAAIGRPEENIPLPDWSREGITDHDLGHGIHMLEGFGGNIGVVTGNDGILMIDAEWPELHDKVFATIRRVSRAPLRYLINTHWHWDHTGGNGRFAHDGAVIFSSPQTRNYILHAQKESAAHANQQVVTNTPYAPDAAGVPAITVPDTLEFHVDGQTIQVMHVRPAHTDGDLLVRFVEADIIQTGDTFFHGFYPDIDQPHGGSIDGMIALYDQLYAMSGPETRIIPGHGPMATRQDVREYQGMLREVRVRVSKGLDSGMSEAALIASHPLDDLDAKWGGNLIKQPYLLAIVYEELTDARKSVNEPPSAPRLQPP